MCPLLILGASCGILGNWITLESNFSFLGGSDVLRLLCVLTWALFWPFLHFAFLITDRSMSISQTNSSDRSDTLTKDDCPALITAAFGPCCIVIVKFSDEITMFLRCQYNQIFWTFFKRWYGKALFKSDSSCWLNLYDLEKYWNGHSKLFWKDRHCQGQPQLASLLTMTKGFEVLDGVKADLSI